MNSGDDIKQYRSSYHQFSAKYHKFLRQQHPELSFSEISRLVGHKWREFKNQKHKKKKPKKVADRSRKDKKSLNQSWRDKPVSEEYETEEGLNVGEEFRDAYREFFQQNHQVYFADPNLSLGDISELIAHKWRSLDKEEKRKYKKLAYREVASPVTPEDQDTMASRKSSRIKKSPVVYQAPEPAPKSSRMVAAKPIPPRRSLKGDIELLMECVDDELSPAQLKAIKEAQREHEKANDLIKEVRAGNILVPSSQPNTFTIVPPKSQQMASQPAQVQAPAMKAGTKPQEAAAQRGLPPPRPAQFLNKQLQEMNKTPGQSSQDVILISDTPAIPSATKIAVPPVTKPIQLQQNLVTAVLPSPGPGATPQQVYKFVSVPSNMPANLVQNQWALRPLLTVPPQQQQQQQQTQMTLLTTAGRCVAQFAPVAAIPVQPGQVQMPAPRASNISGASSQLVKGTEAVGKRAAQFEPASAQPPVKKKNPKGTDITDLLGNWVPLDEYYYGTHEGDISYTEEKGEYRFKCWYCSKMLYNNVRAMQHIQGHIDASKQQNIDLSDLTQCKHCYKQFDTPFEMQTHVEKVHLSNKVLMCRICEKDFATPRELMAHMKGNHHACEMPYVCNLCSFRSSMYSDVVDHFKKKHDSSHYMLCLYCLRTFDVKFVNQGWGQTQTYYGHLLKHMSKSSTKKCVVCRLTFFNAADVKNHRRTCHVPSAHAMKGLTQGGKLDSGQKERKGSNLKSLNAPSVSRIQDYGDITFPPQTATSKCIECKMMMSSTDHYKKYVHCSMCRFATSCSVAYANHMMGFHSGQMSSLNLNIPWERPMKDIMYCSCGFSSKYGNKVANHLVYCAKWTCSTTKKVQTGSEQEKSGDDKKEGSLLGMLGLVQKSAVATNNDIEEIRSVEKPKPRKESEIKLLDKIEVKNDTNITKADAEEKAMQDVMETSAAEVPSKAETKRDSEASSLQEVEPVKNTPIETEKIQENVGLENVNEKQSIEKRLEEKIDQGENDEKCEGEKTDEEKPVEESDISKKDEYPETSKNSENKSVDKSAKESMDRETVKKLDKVDPDEEVVSGTNNLTEAKNEPVGEGKQDLAGDLQEVMDTDTVDQQSAVPGTFNSETAAPQEEVHDKMEQEELIDSCLIEDNVEGVGENTDTEKYSVEAKETEKNEVNLSKENNEDKDTEMGTEPVESAQEIQETEISDDKQSSSGVSEPENLSEKITDTREMERYEPVQSEPKNETTPSDTNENVEPGEPSNESDLIKEEEETGKKETEEPAEIQESGKVPETIGEESVNQEEKQTAEKGYQEKEDEKKVGESPPRQVSSDRDHSQAPGDLQHSQASSAYDHRRFTSRLSGDHRRSSERSFSDNREAGDHHARDRRDSAERHHSGSGDRSRHDDSHYRHDNRSHGSNRSDSYHGNRSSYDQNRDRDRSYDRDRDRDRDYNRNRDHRQGDNRSGYGYQDNRNQGYGSQSYRGSQGQYSSYHGNRGDNYQDRNRGGHHQDRNYNRNYQNRGGYNQNYRGGYRGGYY